MKIFFGIFIIIAVYASISIAKKDDDSLIRILAKERRETEEIYRRENKRLRSADERLQKEDERLHSKVEELVEQNAGLQKQNVKLQEEIAHLRQAHSEIHHAIRQRDDNVTVELKKTIQAEINNFLINEKICVSGVLKMREDKFHLHLPFGYTFPRPPTVVISIIAFCAKYKEVIRGGIEARVRENPTKSSVVLAINWLENRSIGMFDVQWIACL